MQRTISERHASHTLSEDSEEGRLQAVIKVQQGADLVSGFY